MMAKIWMANVAAGIVVGKMGTALGCELAGGNGLHRTKGLIAMQLVYKSGLDLDCWSSERRRKH